VAREKAASPPRVALPVALKCGAQAAEGVKIAAAPVLEILSEVVKGLATISLAARLRGELGRVSDRVAQADGIGKAAKVTLLVLAPLLALRLPSPALRTAVTAVLRGVTRVGSSATFGCVVINNPLPVVGSTCCSRRVDEIPEQVRQVGDQVARGCGSLLLLDQSGAPDFLSWLLLRLRRSHGGAIIKPHPLAGRFIRGLWRSFTGYALSRERLSLLHLGRGIR